MSKPAPREMQQENILMDVDVDPYDFERTYNFIEDKCQAKTKIYSRREVLEHNFKMKTKKRVSKKKVKNYHRAMGISSDNDDSVGEDEFYQGVHEPVSLKSVKVERTSKKNRVRLIEQRAVSTEDSISSKASNVSVRSKECSSFAEIIRKKNIDPKASLFNFNFKDLSKKRKESVGDLKENAEINISQEIKPKEENDIKPMFPKRAQCSVKRKLSFGECALESPENKFKQTPAGQTIKAERKQKKHKKTDLESETKSYNKNINLRNLWIPKYLEIVLEPVRLPKYTKQSCSTSTTSEFLLIEPDRTVKDIETTSSVNDNMRDNICVDMPSSPTTTVRILPNSLPNTSLLTRRPDRVTKNNIRKIYEKEDPVDSGYVENNLACSIATEEIEIRPLDIPVEQNNGMQGVSTNEIERDPLVKFCIDTNETEYLTLKNSQFTGNRIDLRSSQTESCVGYMEPSSITYRKAYPGVEGASFDNTDNTVTGFLKLSPRTVKPLKMTLSGRYIYWILSGEVIVRSTAVILQQGEFNYLFGKKLTSGSCLLVPPYTAYTIENRSFTEDVLLGYVLVNTQDNVAGGQL